ncbi:MAG: hypothetical protein IIX50_01845, partial [Bacteroidaceae bacterium]|nr:hypothetical protein [Bacteroidaceae bacterium]
DQTFQELFSRFFNEISQYADFQRESWKGNFRKDRKIGIYMLQNMVFGTTRSMQAFLPYM